ncbi:hypothetical protein BBK36DRAFT_2061 [Trichoderma citrinoviride]|uniref:Uncharacterized protein n=1 Tax=Trichoderma citrinoviride TaxID=58853 RepID=A0A2T4BH95_9HYPO|nr:hypothetical protein BBK36DRAFT_2061 [Trichoderma citrinoviride]PTB68690.1 hypothetical protein BBK36DRAFT_2061 [Trichoderma citrinoviride]
MVLLEHLPLIGLALSFAHHHSGRAPHHSHPALPNHRHVHQISADMSPYHQAPKLIAARAAEESHETTIQVSQHHLQTILDRIKFLEEEIFNMMLSKADSSLESKSEPSTPSKPETLVVTTREPTAAPTTATVGGLFMEAPADLDAPTKSTTIVTLTTLITQTLTMMPTRILTLTAFPTILAEASPTSNMDRTVDAETYQESKSKAMIPFFNMLASANPAEATASSDSHPSQPFGPPSTDVVAEKKQPEITPLGPGFNASATYHRVSLSAASSGFLTVWRGA